MLFSLLLALAPYQGARAPEPATLTRQTITAESTGAGSRIIRAGKAIPPPNMDGRLDDPAWANATVATDFTQNYPRGGTSATRRTEARVVFSGDAVYVGMRA